MLKKAVQRGRNKRGGEAYVLLYGERLSAVRTKLADFWSILTISCYSARSYPRLSP
jgi:hypothetical protein